VPEVVPTLWAVGTLLSRLARDVHSVSSRCCSPAPTPGFSQRIADEHDALAMATNARTITRLMGGW
jgi:hypothetical protein